MQAVVNAVICARSGLKDAKRLIGSFVYLGHTGIGETEFACALAESLFDIEENIVRIAVSNNMEKHALSRMIGAPPGLDSTPPRYAQAPDARSRSVSHRTRGLSACLWFRKTPRRKSWLKRAQFLVVFLAMVRKFERGSARRFPRDRHHPGIGDLSLRSEAVAGFSRGGSGR